MHIFLLAFASINGSSITAQAYSTKHDEVIVTWEDKRIENRADINYAVWYKRKEFSSSEYQSIGSRCCNVTTDRFKTW